MTGVARHAAHSQRLKLVEGLVPARSVPSAEVDRRFGAAFVNPLTTREYLLLSDPSVRQWPLGGWALLDDQDTVMGYHWRPLYPTLEADWSGSTTAFTAFIPDAEQRRRLADTGWKYFSTQRPRCWPPT